MVLSCEILFEMINIKGKKAENQLENDADAPLLLIEKLSFLRASTS